MCNLGNLEEANGQVLRRGSLLMLLEMRYVTIAAIAQALLNTAAALIADQPSS